VGLELPQRVRTVALGAVAGSALLLLSGCSADDKDQIKRLAMPEPATKEAHHVYDLWQGAWLAAILTGIVVWGLIFYAVWRFRRRSEAEIPVQTRYNLPIEIFYTIAPVMMVIVFFYFTVSAQNDILHASKNLEDAKKEADYSITVVGQQWSWTFNYDDAYQGDTVFEAGTTDKPPTLWLVEDKSVSVQLYSPDVIHSFGVPAFLFKMDVVPGRDNHFTFTPDRAGSFEGRCAELCGVYHSRMLFNVKVVSQSEFDDHMRALSDEGNVGPALGGEHSTKVPGLGEDEHTDSETGGSK
jgi:cytochrome c oxidase subunit 2